jgi:epoxyqueuosine reductase
MEIKKIIEKHLFPEKDFIYGFADLDGLTSEEYKEYPYGLVIGKRLDPSIINQVVGGPTLDYYDHYRSLNDQLYETANRIAADLNQAGIETKSLTPSVTTEELDTIYNQDLRTALSHKMVATRAGLGWIGKTALFVSKKFGTRLRLVSLLIKEQILPTGTPIEKSLCGKCSICVDICPAKAANGRSWDIHTDRDEFFDPFACREQCRIFGEEFNQPIRICGICVAACPMGLR